MPDAVTSEVSQVEVNPDIYKRLDAYTHLSAYSNNERDERARIQQEIGVKAIPSLLKLIKEEKLGPFYAITLLEGMDGDDQTFYDTYRNIAYMPQAYQDRDHSAVSKALRYMVATSLDKNQFLEDAENLSFLYKREIENPKDLSLTISHIEYLTGNYSSSKKINSETLEMDRKESREIYKLGLAGYVSKLEEESPRVQYDTSYYDDDMDSEEEAFRDAMFDLEWPEDGDLLGSLSGLIRKIKTLEIATGKNDYIVLSDDKMRHQVVEIGRKVSEYVHDRGIQDIIFVDRSARPGYIAVIENWKKMYPGEDLPNIYFMNPKGFKSLEDVEKDDELLDFILDEASGKGDRIEGPELLRSKNTISQDLRKSYPRLFDKTGRHVLLFDACIHSGRSVGPMIEQLTTLGLDVRVGIVSPARNNSGISADFQILDDDPEGGCYPFDRDRMVEKTFTRVHALRSDDVEQQTYGRQIRKEIKRAVSEFYS